MRATNMSALSERAAAILEQMEPNQGYEASELRAFAPNLNLEALREVMHELWIARQVERYRDTGWRRAGSTCGPRETLEPASALRCASANTGTGDAASRRIGNVRPEDLFDHDSFAGWFK